ncbi:MULTISPECIES: hypothetical protein [Pseudomonas]|uniref:DUF3618 domain-containing protein n=1 Tax=Pseudomonas izuensis TaxID=2684212 RepID=A0ABM7RV68_9PSED|nr:MULTISPECIES: hypothetical protein [Pseudomonas]RKS28205.1 hypothetical protein BJ917_1076 [Pseudomonas sp. WPR_5_2]BCX68909.1 hypothetical protein LAB08_R35510 [Pseudomonas izuensis]
MHTQPTNQDNIEQLRRDIASLAEEMRRPAPSAARASLLPFCIGVAFALATFVVVTLIAKSI